MVILFWCTLPQGAGRKTVIRRRRMTGASLMCNFDFRASSLRRFFWPVQVAQLMALLSFARLIGKQASAYVSVR